MKTAESSHTTSLFQVVADMQESMEMNGLSPDIIDVIVTRGLELLFRLGEEQAQIA